MSRGKPEELAHEKGNQCLMLMQSNLKDTENLGNGVSIHKTKLQLVPNNASIGGKKSGLIKYQALISDTFCCS